MRRRLRGLPDAVFAGPVSGRRAGIMNVTRAVLLASEASFALSRAERRRGLAGRHSMGPGEALIFPRCRQVHSFGMLFDIDVLFLDRRGDVVMICRGFSPRRVSPLVWRARVAVELPAGTAARTGTVNSDRLEITRGST